MYATEEDARVRSGHAIIVRAVNLVGVHEAEQRLAAEIAPHAQDVVDRVVAPARRVRAIVDAREQADAESRNLPRQLESRHRLHQASRVHERERCSELLEALEKEWALLREIECQARVEHELSRVRLDLGEVGPRRGRESEVVGHAPAYVAAEVGGDRTVRPPRATGRAVRLGRDLGAHVEHQAAVELGQSRQRPGLGEKRRRRETRRRPRLPVA